MKRKKSTTAQAFDQSLALLPGDEHYVLRLYITGMTLRSAEAIASIRAICEEHLQGRCNLEVIDIYQHPQLAKDEQIIAAHTLVKKRPLPLRRMIGNLADHERVLFGLDLRRASPTRDT